MRDLRVRYGGVSGPSVLLSLVSPILTLVVFGLADHLFIHQHPKNFGLFLIPAFLAWSHFVSTVLAGSRSVEGQAYLLLNCNFPRAILPLATIGSQMLMSLPATLLFLLLYFPLGGQASPMLLLFPIVWILQWCLIVGFVLISCSLQVFFRDTCSLLQVSLTLLFWLTPVLYDLQSAPAQARPWLACLNPMASLIELSRAVFNSWPFPSPLVLLSALLWSGLTLLGGIWIFSRLEGHFCSHL